LKILHEYPALRNYIFERTTLWLKPTMEDKWWKRIKNN
jgi:hypothetical protein